MKTPVELSYYAFKELVNDFDQATRFIISLDKSGHATFHPIGVPLPKSSIGGAVITISEKTIEEAKANPAQIVPIMLKAVNRSSLFLELDMLF